MDWSTCSFLQGIDGKLDMSTIREPSKDLLNNWNEHYPAFNFRACKAFQGVDVHQDANRQIQKSQFQQVSLIKNLVKTFENLYPHLSIDQVWLLWKSKSGDGFQGCHQDMVECMTHTIVINLGSEDNADDLKMKQIWCLCDQGLDASKSNKYE
jgi:hypothetical protein